MNLANLIYVRKIVLELSSWALSFLFSFLGRIFRSFVFRLLSTSWRLNNVAFLFDQFNQGDIFWKIL